MYWDWYKHRQRFEPNMFEMYATEQHSPKQLYVRQKYENYKEETLQHLSQRLYELLMKKADEYMQTVIVKCMHANNPFDEDYFHYGIEVGMDITIQHIISIILYTDYSDYCTQFTESFRKLSFGESFVSVKKRNSEFWHQSKYFRETVEFWGQFGYKDDNYHKYYEKVCNFSLFQHIINSILH